MCGIAGIVSIGSSPAPVVAERMGAALAHRGPDDNGLWHDHRCALAHRRLSVIDPGPAGHQPMTTADGRFVIAYNGELYNDADVRTDLESHGTRFNSRCDTETVLHALARWGPAARDRFRGMYAFALWDTHRGRLTLGRDELGVKPLYYAQPSTREFAFASEPAALFEHPSLSPRPDPIAVSAYLSIIQISFGGRTLFEGVRALEPGEWITIDADTSPDSVAQTSQIHVTQHAPEWTSSASPVATTRDTVAESTRLHLRADVPTCSLLSGGLDSAVLATLALDTLPALDTYCAGSKDPEATSEDFTHARLVADHIGSRHTESPVSQELFATRWPEMVHAAGLPLCTPNEVAINEVARTLRADGKVVTLSGEGADELFGGYAVPLSLAMQHINATPDETSDAAHALATITWIGPEPKAALLNTPARDDHLAAWFVNLYADSLEQIEADFAEANDADRRLHTMLRLQRRVNLPNLLRRLDQATMLASVEGRTPFADRVVARHAETLPMIDRYRHHPTEPGTKLALRHAFADRLPAAVTSRPKASFPLPFERWLTPLTPALDGAFAKELFTPEARQFLATDPGSAWNIAWPALNLAIWGERWWGR